MSKKLTLLLITFLFLGVSFFLFKSQIVSNYFLNYKIDKCSQEKNQKCFVDLVMTTFKESGLENSLHLISTIYAKDPAFAESCHDIGHLLGKETFKLFKEGTDFKITPEASFCSYGFYHGFMENLVSSDGDPKKAREFCKYVDSQIAKETPDAALQCFHGIGHGWVNVHDDKSLWGDDLGIVKKGLVLCDKVSENESELSRCATGVFNGLSVFYSTGEYDIKVKKEDPLWVCKLQDEKFQDPCFISMNLVLMSLSGGDLKLASKFVEPIKDNEVAQHTMLNLAITLGVENINSTDHIENINICRSLQKRLVNSCIQGYAFAFLEHGEPKVEYIKAIEFCKNSHLNTNESESCLSYIYSYLPQWYKEEKVFSICEGEGDTKDFCKQKVEEFKNNQN